MAVSLLQLCINAAYAIDDLKPYGVTSGTVTSVTATGLINLTANASTDTYDGAWLHFPDTQVKTTTGGYTPGAGTLAFTPSVGAPTAGQTLYVTWLFPISASSTPGEDTPYSWFVQESLKHLVYEDEGITLPISPGLSLYSLATYQHWLDRQARLLAMYELAPVAGYPDVDARFRNPRIVRRGTTVYLQLKSPFEAGAAGVIRLKALRPAYTLVGGAESTTGPTADASSVEANPEDVQIGVLAFIYYALANRQASSPDGANWAGMYATQKAEFEGLAAYDKTRRMPPAPASAEAA